ncbi:MAG: TolC family protein [Alphaproteobacteria bacterium]|nr:TolC family protein [Alphaproteobacteria bacterium]
MLRKSIFVCSLSAVLFLPAAAPAATLSDSVITALSSHPQIKAGEASRSQADKNIWEQRSAFFPTIGLEAGAGHLNNNDLNTRAATLDKGGADTWVGEGSLTLTQPIYSGQSTSNRLLGAENRYLAAAYDLNGTVEDVALRAIHAHLNLMRSKELLGLSSQLLADIDGRRKNIDLMVKAGAADEAELLQADEILAATKNTRLDYEESFREAEADYIEATGGVPDAGLELGEAKWESMIPTTLEDAVTNAIKESPRVRSANEISTALNSETQAEKGNLLPHVDAEMSYSKLDQRDVAGGESASARAMIKMGWNFSTGGGQLARIEKSLQQQEEAAAKRQGVMRSVEHGVRQKYSSMLIADQQFTLLADRESASKKILENFLAQFEGGKQTNLQLIAASSKLFEAQAASADAYYRRILLRFELLNAMGRLRNVFEAAKTGVSQRG